MGKPAAVAVKAPSRPGQHTDGAGLHLYLRPDGRKGWVLRFRRDGKLRDVGLGSLVSWDSLNPDPTFV